MHLSKPIECRTQSQPWRNRRLQLMYENRIPGTDTPQDCKVLIVEGTMCVCLGEGNMGTLYLLLNFSVGLKVL